MRTTIKNRQFVFIPRINALSISMLLANDLKIDFLTKKCTGFYCCLHLLEPMAAAPQANWIKANGDSNLRYFRISKGSD